MRKKKIRIIKKKLKVIPHLKKQKKLMIKVTVKKKKKKLRMKKTLLDPNSNNKKIFKICLKNRLDKKSLYKAMITLITLITLIIILQMKVLLEHLCYLNKELEAKRHNNKFKIFEIKLKILKFKILSHQNNPYLLDRPVHLVLMKKVKKIGNMMIFCKQLIILKISI